jgi:hypothetical protein
MSEENLTPLEMSRSRTGRRFFKALPEVYLAVSNQVDSSIGYPSGVGSKAVTERGLPELSRLKVQDEGHVEISVECWRITNDLDSLLKPLIDSGQIEELVK